MAQSTREGVLVLGAGGFLGPHLVRAALAVGSRPVVAVRRGPEPPPGVGAREGLCVRAVDLLREDATEHLLDDVAPRTVLLSAALSRANDCDRDPVHARAMNVALPARVARWCARHGARLVHVSTDLVFGAHPPAGERYSEGDAPSPVNEYGHTKAAGERAVLTASSTALVVRLPLLYGDAAGRELGASDSLLAALARGEKPRLFSDEWRTPLDVSDAAAAVVEAAAGEIAGVLHVAGPRRLNRLQLGQEVLRAKDRPTGEYASLVACARAEAGLADSRAADASLDASRARRLLQTPLLPPEDALRRSAAGRG